MAERRKPMGGHPGRMTTERAKDFKGTMRKLFRYMGRYKVAFVLVVIFAILSTIFTIIGPKILGTATTELYNGAVAEIQGTGHINFEKLGWILLMLLALYVASAVFGFIQGWIMSGITQKMSYNLRRDISIKINHMPISYFESNKIGDVLSRITNDVDTMGMNLNQSVTQMLTAVCTVIGVIIMMLMISPMLTLITILVLPVSGIAVFIIVKFSQKHFKAQQDYLGEIDGHIEETFGGHNVIKAFNREEQETGRFNEINEKLYKSAWKSQFLSGLMMPVTTFVGNLGYVAVAIFGTMFAFSGVIMVGDIVSFIQYVKRFTQPITQLAQVSNMIQAMTAAAERVFEFLDEPEEAHTEDTFDASLINGEVVFDHVKFGYVPEKTIIKDFNARITKGMTVAIVGPTGAGKTTIVKLLMRFYDVNDGSISLDGIDIRRFHRHELRNHFGMVLQDTWLFSDTIMENIRYGRLDATDEEVIAAAKAAHAHHFIKTLAGGYNMVINEDASNISQGQKQLLTIARVILANRQISILDEATSSVDTRTEQQIQDAMDELMKDRTSFVIAHRLSTIRNADLILVMKDGDIIEQGDHKSLLEQNGFYAELYNSQFETSA